MRLIDADALIKRCMNGIDNDFIDIVNEMPTVKVLNKIRAEIEPKCDRINSLASVLPYTAHREIQELLCEIMDLPSVEQEPKESEG